MKHHSETAGGFFYAETSGGETKGQQIADCAGSGSFGFCAHSNSMRLGVEQRRGTGREGGGLFLDLSCGWRGGGRTDTAREREERIDCGRRILSLLSVVEACGIHSGFFIAANAARRRDLRCNSLADFVHFS